MSGRYHLPDWVVTGLVDGSVDHLDYTVPNVAHIVMADGSAQDISVEVTPEVLEADLDAILLRFGPALAGVKIKVPISRKNWHGVITGWTK